MNKTIIILIFNFYYYTKRELSKEKKEGLLKDQPEHILKYVQESGIPQVRLAWIIHIKLKGFRLQGDNQFSIAVDTENGKILGRY